MIVVAVFLGDEVGAPAVPEGRGAVVVRYRFASRVRLVADCRVVNDRPNYELWVPAPVALIDATPVRASWSLWCYLLPPGGHQIEVTGPAAAIQRVEVSAGEIRRVEYRVEIVIDKDPTDTDVIEWHATGGFQPA